MKYSETYVGPDGRWWRNRIYSEDERREMRREAEEEYQCGNIVHEEYIEWIDDCDAEEHEALDEYYDAEGNEHTRWSRVRY